MAATIDVRSIHPAIGADETVTGFSDQNSTFTSHYSLTLCEGHFRYSRVEIVTPCPGARTGGGLDFFQENKLAFRLGDDFVFYDQDVAHSR